MNFKEYQSLAQLTSNTVGSLQKVENGILGLNGEAGELIDHLKKAKFQGHSMDYKKLLDELSDVLWYCAELATGLGTDLENVARYNIDKLKRRYPEGKFSVERSVNRDE